MKYYEENAKEYIASTIATDMSSAYRMVRRYLPDNGCVLDVGFGSARDMIFFRKEGYHVTGIDNCAAFVEHAKEIGFDAKCEDILSYRTETKYDLIWCCASLLHLKREDVLPTIMKYLSFLKRGGILFLSMKYANKNDGYDDKGRYFIYFNNKDVDNLKAYIKDISFEKDATREDLLWVNLILKNNASKEAS